MVSASDILDQLDECGQDSMGFPNLAHGYFYLSNIRLSAYRSNGFWALVIETLVFDNRDRGHNCISTLLYCYGNGLPRSPGVSYPALHVTEDGPGGPLFDSNDILEQLISVTASDINIRGTTVRIPTTSAAYAGAGIQLTDPPRIQGYELLRYLGRVHFDLFFATQGEIAERIGSYTQPLLRIFKWRHPHVENGERPSDAESFQMIAEALAANDPRLYQPMEPSNTDWSNWPMAGSL